MILTAEEYREIALRECLRRALTVQSYVLWCKGGCGTHLTASYQHSYAVERGQATAQFRLIDRAMREGWQIDGGGDVACKSCSDALAARVARRAGHTGATSEGA